MTPISVRRSGACGRNGGSTRPGAACRAAGSSWHPELVQAYTGVKGCSACRAEDPLGDGKWRETTATLTFYADEQCTQPLPTTNIYDKCFNLPPGSLPRSVTATLAVERIAACEAVGGEQEGELAPEGLVSFCCKAPR